MSDKNMHVATGNRTRYVVVAAIIVIAFFGAYRFAIAATNPAQPASGGVAATQAAYSGAVDGTDDSSALACACCGGASGSTEPVEGAATADADGVQRLTVDTSTGGYNPNVIKLQAGVPAEITFGQAGGCLAQVMSQDLGFYEDLQSGAKTVSLPALEAGTYSFSCGMEMVFGSIVVE